MVDTNELHNFGEMKALDQEVVPTSIAGWSSPVARQAHNLKAAGSNPAPATLLLYLGGSFREKQVEASSLAS